MIPHASLHCCTHMLVWCAHKGAGVCMRAVHMVVREQLWLSILRVLALRYLRQVSP